MFQHCEQFNWKVLTLIISKRERELNSQRPVYYYSHSSTKMYCVVYIIFPSVQLQWRRDIGWLEKQLTGTTPPKDVRYDNPTRSVKFADFLI